jgi:transposase-like protein
MIKRARYPQEAKEKLVLEIVSGQNTMAAVAKREGISISTLANWRDALGSGEFQDRNRTEIELRKKIGELESLVSDLALQNHILKKARKHLADWQRKERLSGSISRLSSASQPAARQWASASPPSTTSPEAGSAGRKMRRR